VSIHHEGLWNKPEVGKDGVEEHLSFSSVTIKDGRRVWSED
jgi:hypothetical protein